MLPGRRSERERQRGKGNIYQASKEADGGNGRGSTPHGSSGSRISPGLVKVFKYSLLWVTTSLLKPQGAPYSPGCWCLPSHRGQRGVLVVWHCPPSASSVLCAKTGSQPAHTLPELAVGHATTQEAQLMPGLPPRHDPSPARTGWWGKTH